MAKRMQSKPEPNCKRCNVPLVEGIALTNPGVGSPDFLGDTGDEIGCTMSPDTRNPKIQKVMKCLKCGWSVTK